MSEQSPTAIKRRDAAVAVALLAVAVIVAVAARHKTVNTAGGDGARAMNAAQGAAATGATVGKPPEIIDKVAYDRRMLQLAHVDPSQYPKATAIAPLAPKLTPHDLLPVPVPKPQPPAEKKPAQPHDLWPVKNLPYPLPGAILPFKRIVAYYGNFYAKGMGVLGEYPTDVMLEKLHGELDKWTAADPATPVMPAIDYIAVSAQGNAGKDGMYRARMPGTEIDKAMALADQLHGIVILEVQAGLSDIMTEVKLLEPFLLKPQVHLAIDPEFAMRKSGVRPGLLVGTVDAAEMNAVAAYLAKLVDDHKLPPKVLIIHRYTQGMVTNSASIKPLPEVQILMDMDGWGYKTRKLSTYRSFIYGQPVQFTGFKLFYKNDIKTPGTALMTPQDVLELTPQPSFIQFQ